MLVEPITAIRTVPVPDSNVFNRCGIGQAHIDRSPLAGHARPMGSAAGGRAAVKFNAPIAPKIGGGAVRRRIYCGNSWRCVNPRRGQPPVNLAIARRNPLGFGCDLEGDGAAVAGSVNIHAHFLYSLHW